jgi:hypothetical protein
VFHSADGKSQGTEFPLDQTVIYALDNSSHRYKDYTKSQAYKQEKPPCFDMYPLYRTHIIFTGACSDFLFGQKEHDIVAPLYKSGHRIGL